MALVLLPSKNTKDLNGSSNSRESCKTLWVPLATVAPENAANKQKGLNPVSTD